MQAQSAGNALARSPERRRTLVASNGAVWIWPGIPLTLRRGRTICPAAETTIRFWISRLQGADALHKELNWAVGSATRHLNAGNETAAQRILDSLGLTSVTPAGVAFMLAVAEDSGAYIPDVFVDSQYSVTDASNASLKALLIGIVIGATSAISVLFLIIAPRSRPQSRATSSCFAMVAVTATAALSPERSRSPLFMPIGRRVPFWRKSSRATSSFPIRVACGAFSAIGERRRRELSAHESAGCDAGLYRSAIADLKQRNPHRHFLRRNEDCAEYHLDRWLSLQRWRRKRRGQGRRGRQGRVERDL